MGQIRLALEMNRPFGHFCQHLISKLVGAYASLMSATSSLPLSNLESSLGYISEGDSQRQVWCFEVVKYTLFMLE